MSKHEAGLESVPVQPDAERSAARLRAVIDTGPAAIAAIDPDGVVTLWGGGAERVTGLPASDAVGSPLSALLEGVQLEPLLDPSGTPGGPEPAALAVAHRDDDDDVVVALYATPVPNPDGAVVEALVVLEDVTDTRRLEEELHESRELFRVSAEHLLDAFGIFTAVRDDEGHIVDFRIEYANDAAREVAGIDPDVEDGSLAALVPQRERDVLFGDFARIVETGSSLAGETLTYEDVTGGGRRVIRAYDIRATKLKDGVAATWRDVTERVLAETELGRRNRELTVMGELAELLQAVTSPEEVFELAASFGARLFEDLSGGLYLENESGTLVEGMSTWGGQEGSRQVFAPDDCWALRRGRRHGGLGIAPSPALLARPRRRARIALRPARRPGAGDRVAPPGGRGCDEPLGPTDDHHGRVARRHARRAPGAGVDEPASARIAPEPVDPGSPDRSVQPPVHGGDTGQGDPSFGPKRASPRCDDVRPRSLQAVQ